MTDDPSGAPAPSAVAAVRSRILRFARRLSLSRVQAFVATLAGIASVSGALFSLVQFAGPGTKGELVAVVQSAGSRRPVTDATVEVLTTQEAIVATLTPDADGRAAQKLSEGLYIVRVSHPRYAAETRRIQVVARQTTEVRTSLHAGTSSPLDRTVNKGVRALRNALRF